MSEIKQRIDSAIFKILMTCVLVGIPAIIYKFWGVTAAEVAAFCELVFLSLATAEDVRDLKEKYFKDK